MEKYLRKLCRPDILRYLKCLSCHAEKPHPIAIPVDLFGRSGDGEAMDTATKAMLDDMHKRKIDMADEIYVISVGDTLEAAPAPKSSMQRH